MAVNKNSEVGSAEDLLRSIVQMSCAEIHAQGLYYKTTAEMDKADMYQEDIAVYADLRRQMMNELFSMFEGGDKDMWCMIKHLGLSAMQCFEAYENSDDNPALLNIAYEANKAFTKAVTRFLGVEVGDCAACLSDALKGKENIDESYKG